MKDVLKITLGILLAIAICVAIILPIKAYLTPSAYEKCNINCEIEKSLDPLLFSSTDEYVEYMAAVSDECLKRCEDTWGLHDEFHWLTNVTYIRR